MYLKRNVFLFLQTFRARLLSDFTWLCLLDFSATVWLFGETHLKICLFVCVIHYFDWENGGNYLFDQIEMIK